MSEVEDRRMPIIPVRSKDPRLDYESFGPSGMDDSFQWVLIRDATSPPLTIGQVLDKMGAVLPLYHLSAEELTKFNLHRFIIFDKPNKFKYDCKESELLKSEYQLKPTHFISRMSAWKGLVTDIRKRGIK